MHTLNAHRTRQVAVLYHGICGNICPYLAMLSDHSVANGIKMDLILENDGRFYSAQRTYKVLVEIQFGPFFIRMSLEKGKVLSVQKPDVEKLFCQVDPLPSFRR